MDLQDIVARRLTIIGEAAATLLKKHPDFCEQNPVIPLRQARGMRNALVHDYGGIKWDIVHESAHLFREEMENLRRSGLADEAMLQNMKTLDEWLARFDDNTTLEAAYKKGLRKSLGLGNKKFSKLSDAGKAQMREVAKHEYFARGLEAYMREETARLKNSLPYSSASKTGCLPPTRTPPSLTLN